MKSFSKSAATTKVCQGNNALTAEKDEAGISNASSRPARKSRAHMQKRAYSEDTSESSETETPDKKRGKIKKVDNAKGGTKRKK